MNIKHLISSAMLSSACAAAVALSASSFAIAGSSPSVPTCVPLVHSDVKIKPTYYYKPGGQSYVRVGFESKVQNASRNGIYYIDRNVPSRAYSKMEISAQGETLRVRSNVLVEKTLVPAGKNHEVQNGNRFLNVKLPHLNVDMKVTLKGTIINSSCKGRAATTYMSRTYDLRPMLTGGKAKQVGITLSNFSIPPVPRPGGAPAPGPRT